MFCKLNANGKATYWSMHTPWWRPTTAPKAKVGQIREGLRGVTSIHCSLGRKFGKTFQNGIDWTDRTGDACVVSNSKTSKITQSSISLLANLPDPAKLPGKISAAQNYPWECWPTCLPPFQSLKVELLQWGSCWKMMHHGNWTLVTKAKSQWTCPLKTLRPRSTFYSWSKGISKKD